jgi:HTH-type transcriptional regulator/antitoxin HigA
MQSMMKSMPRPSDQIKSNKIYYATVVFNENNTLPDVDPIELIKIRMADFGYKSADLAKQYGDKGTVSKVLNYKQALSLTMIRKFSALLRIPASALIKEYQLAE